VTRARIALAVVVVAGALAAPRAARAEPRRYVMIIAHNRSLDPGVAPLRFADDDGARYFELFKLITDRVALFSVLDDETAALFPAAARAAQPPEADAIYGTLRRWNKEMADETHAGRSTELVFIYAGHGDVDASGEGYVNLLRSKLRRRDLYEKVLAPSKASYVHLIIDACKSYFLVKRRGGEPWKDDSAPESHDDEVRAFLSREDLSSYPRVGVILATSGDQATHEWSRFRGGILSYELRSALAGPADINGDGRVEYSEMHAFIAAANARLRHAEARLNIFVRPPQSNRHQPLVDLRAVQGSRGRLLRFDAPLSGHYYLDDDRGVRYVDLHKAHGVRFDLAVERDRTYYVHSTRGEAQEARLAPGSKRVAVAELSFSRRALAMRGSIEQSFRKDLYQLAYSRGFYDGFCARTGLAPVEGGPEEFIVSTPAPAAPPAERHHQLLVGYMVSSALLDLGGASHGLHARYDLGVHRFFTVGAAVEYGHTGVGSAQLHRFAALVGAAARFRVVSRLTLHADLALGYQGYFGSGPMQLMGRTVEGSDTLGFRLEIGAGVQLDLTSRLYADVRGGVSVEVVTIDPQKYANTAPYGAIGLGLRF
jgi:hypothetical protein